MVSDEDKARFLEILRDQPIVSVACKRAGIGRPSVYRWREEDVEFKKGMAAALSMGRSLVNDGVESNLIKAALRGDPWAMRYWLEAHSRPYYRPRKPIAAPTPKRTIRKIIMEVVDNRPQSSDPPKEIPIVNI